MRGTVPEHTAPTGPRYLSTSALRARVHGLPTTVLDLRDGA